MKNTTQKVEEKREKPQDTVEGSITLSRDDAMKLASVLSDVQEFVTSKRENGKINLVKGVLFGTSEIKKDGLTFWFESKNANSRFCDACGLLRVGEYRQCDCEEEKPKEFINTAGGKAKFVKTEVENADGQWNDSYYTRDGYWVIHEGFQHHVYQEVE